MWCRFLFDLVTLEGWFWFNFFSLFNSAICSYSENLATATFRIIPHEGPSFPKNRILKGWPNALIFQFLPISCLTPVVGINLCKHAHLPPRSVCVNRQSKSASNVHRNSLVTNSNSHQLLNIHSTQISFTFPLAFLVPISWNTTVQKTKSSKLNFSSKLFYIRSDFS